MSTRLKMAASAAVAAALTAALFLTFGQEPTPRSDPSAEPAAADATPAPIIPPVAPPLPRDLPRIEGDGVIRGHVATAEGVGVEGVLIVATPVPARSGRSYFDPPPELDLEEEIRRAVELAHRRVTGTRRAMSTADGSYELGRLGDVGYSLQPYSPGYDIRKAKGHSTWDVKPGATVDFVARAVVAVRVHIEGIDETSSDRISVLRARDEGALTRAGGSGWSANSPVLRMDPGTWWLQAVQGRDRVRVSEPQEVTLQAGASEQSVVLHLLDRPGLGGSIVFTDDLDPQRVHLLALRFEGSQPPPLEHYLRRAEALRTTYDPRDGRYSFRDIGPGRYVVWVTLGGDGVMGSCVVQIRDRMVEQEIRVGVDDPESFVVVRAIGPDGKPLDARSTRISTSYKSPRMGASGGGTTIHRKDGSWLVAQSPRVPSPADQTGGIYRIKVTHRDMGSQESAYDPKTQRELEFRFGKASSLTVSIAGLDQSGLDGRASLFMKKAMEPTGMSLSGGRATSSGNVFVYDKVQPGTWFLVLVAREGGLVFVDRLSITVGEGENRIDWALPRLHTVRLEPAKKEKPVRFGLVRLDPAGNWMHQFASSTDDGPAVFRYVPAGRYELVGTYEGKKRNILIDVPAQSLVRLE